MHAQGFWWDSLIELAVTCTAFPEAVLTADLRNSRYVNAEEASCGFDRPEQLAELAMHEFGHSFVNHALEPPRHKGPITRFAALYTTEPATGQMGHDDPGPASPSTSSAPARSASPWSQGNRKARRAYCSTISNSMGFIICRR